MSGRVTIADVAREAGVSLQTVSRALNGKGEISAATRDRVLAVIARLGYRPSGVARSLVAGRTLTVGLVVPDITNPFFPAIAAGAEEAAGAAGYGLLLCNTGEDPQREADVLRTLDEKRVDGVILCSARLPDAGLLSLLAGQRAAVLVNRRLPSFTAAAGSEGNASQPQLASVRVDDALGARLAVGHLTGCGRRRVALLAGPPASHSGQARREGYAAGLAAASLLYDPALVRPCAPDLAGGLQAGLALLAERPEIDALLCFNDLVALGALQACAQLGRAVPEQIAVVGTDDIPLAALVTPPLTTVHIPQRAVGTAAVAVLLDMLGSRGSPAAETVLEPELVLRASA